MAQDPRDRDRPQPREAPEHARAPSDETPAADVEERDYGAHAEHVTEEANFREDETPPGADNDESDDDGYEDEGA